MAANHHSPKPLKMLEYAGKEILTEFLNKMVQNNVLKLEEDERQKFNSAEPRDKRYVFVDILKQKRHKAGQVLLQTFLNVDRNMSDVEVSPEVYPEMKTKPEEQEEAMDTLQLCPPEELMKQQKEKAQDIYPIKEKSLRTRQALIICNTEFKHLPERYGANCDITGMKRLLNDLGYNVVVKEDLTAQVMISELKNFAALPEHETSDSTFLVFMSHGIPHGLCGTMHSEHNSDVLHYDTIYQIFNNSNCPGLRNKPKVIIVQACRGGNSGDIWIQDSSETWADGFSESPRNMEADSVQRSHVEKDFIAFFSSTPNNKSYRDGSRGSFFITQLIACFQKYSCLCHLEDVFQKVQQSFEKPSIHAQMPTIERKTLTRHFYLFPGH